jgi:dethiobiotin synthetase
MIPKQLFVTGTDTEVGKTKISTGLIQLLQQQGLTTVGMKPIASGCEWLDEQWKNEDALALAAVSDVSVDYSLLNPFAFEPAIAPHLAAQQANTCIDLSLIEVNYQQLKQCADAVVVEGAGGWLVPLDETQTMADLAMTLQLPVVLVVAIRLGCINHALLSVEAIKQSGLPLVGWVANHPAKVTESAEIIATLQQRIEAPCLGVVPTLQAEMSALPYLHC